MPDDDATPFSGFERHLDLDASDDTLRMVSLERLPPLLCRRCAAAAMLFATPCPLSRRTAFETRL